MNRGELEQAVTTGFGRFSESSGSEKGCGGMERIEELACFLEKSSASAAQQPALG